MTGKAHNLAHQVQERTQNLLDQVREQALKEQALKGARTFYRNSLGSLKSRLESDRSQLEDLLRQLPRSHRDTQAYIEELVASYKVIEDSLDEETARAHGAKETATQPLQQAQETGGRAAQQERNVVGEATGQTREAGVVGGWNTLEAQIDDEIRIPVVEEEIVIEKRPVVKEEIRVRKKIVEEEEIVEEDVRREEVDVEEDRYVS